MILKSHKYVKVKVKDYSDRGVSLSNLPTEKLVSDLLNFCSNDVLIVTVCRVQNGEPKVWCSEVKILRF